MKNTQIVQIRVGPDQVIALDCVLDELDEKLKKTSRIEDQQAIRRWMKDIQAISYQLATYGFDFSKDNKGNSVS